MLATLCRNRRPPSMTSRTVSLSCFRPQDESIKQTAFSASLFFGSSTGAVQRSLGTHSKLI
jgi:hypothetical protein